MMDPSKDEGVALYGDFSQFVIKEEHMTAGASGITEFLFARITEDEAEVSSLATVYVSCADEAGWCAEGDQVVVAVGLGRAKAECEAKRRIVEEVECLRAMIPEHVIGDGDEHEAVIVEWAEAAVLAPIASIYADHEDYDEEWAL